MSFIAIAVETDSTTVPVQNGSDDDYVSDDINVVEDCEHVENVDLLHKYCHQCRRSRVRHSSEAGGQIGILYSDRVLWSKASVQVRDADK